MIRDPRQHSAEEILRDGGSILIRAIRPDDRERLVEHFRRLSARSVYFRFFNAKRRLTDDELDRFTRLDFVQQAALVATLRERRDERIIGVGRYAMLPGDAHAAEVAFAVADEHQGRGIGTLLLEHLVRLARANGITEFRADVLGENNGMLQVFARSGFVVTSSLATWRASGTPVSSPASRPRSRIGSRSSRSNRAARRPAPAPPRATRRRSRASTSRWTPCSHRRGCRST